MTHQKKSEQFISSTGDTPSFESYLMSKMNSCTDIITGDFFTKKGESGTEYYFGARYYNPKLGRFITKDPIKDGINHFVYANNNPLRYIDRWGLQAEEYYEDLDKIRSEITAILDAIWQEKYIDLPAKKGELEEVEENIKSLEAEKKDLEDDLNDINLLIDDYRAAKEAEENDSDTSKKDPSFGSVWRGVNSRDLVGLPKTPKEDDESSDDKELKALESSQTSYEKEIKECESKINEEKKKRDDLQKDIVKLENNIKRLEKQYDDKYAEEEELKNYIASLESENAELDEKETAESVDDNKNTSTQKSSQPAKQKYHKPQKTSQPKKEKSKKYKSDSGGESWEDPTKDPNFTFYGQKTLEEEALEEIENKILGGYKIWEPEEQKNIINIELYCTPEQSKKEEISEEKLINWDLYWGTEAKVREINLYKNIEYYGHGGAVVLRTVADLIHKAKLGGGGDITFTETATSSVVNEMIANKMVTISAKTDWVFNESTGTATRTIDTGYRGTIVQEGLIYNGWNWSNPKRTHATSNMKWVTNE